MINDNMELNDDNQLRSSELWITAITGAINTVLVSSAPTHTSITLVVCLSLTAIVYLICRTCFKIAKMKYAPHSAIEFTASTDSKFNVIQE